MFTGIVEELGTVEAVEDQGDAVRLTVRAADRARGRRAGRLDRRQRLLPDRRRRAPTAPGPPTSWQETLDKTSARRRSRPATGSTSSAPSPPTTRLGGHIVQGHVDGVGTIAAPHPERALGGRRDLAARATWRRYLVDKGSITVDGVSLTVVEAGDDELHRQPDPRDPGPHHARLPRRRRPGQPRGRRDRQVRREAARARLPRAAQPAPGEDVLTCSTGCCTARSPSATAASTWREILGNLFGLASALARACAAGSGPGRSASSATSCSSRVFVAGELERPDRRRAAVGPGRPPGLLRRRPASTAGGAGTPRRAAAPPTAARSRPRWATARRAAASCSAAAVVGYAAGLRAAARGSARWGPGHRRLDLRRLACSRRTPWRAAGWSSGWPGSRVDLVGVTTLVPGRLLPDRGHVPRSTAASCVVGLRRLVARQPATADPGVDRRALEGAAA